MGFGLMENLTTSWIFKQLSRIALGVYEAYKLTQEKSSSKPISVYFRTNWGGTLVMCSPIPRCIFSPATKAGYRLDRRLVYVLSNSSKAFILSNASLTVSWNSSDSSSSSRSLNIATYLGPMWFRLANFPLIFSNPSRISANL